MNKAFVREPDQKAEYCPRCGAQGEAVGRETLKAYLAPDDWQKLADPANFCPSPQCDVAYFDMFERAVTKDRLTRAAYLKDPQAPICACFGLTREDVERDVAEGVVTRTKAALEKARSPAARCSELAANGRCCAAYVQRYYMQVRQL